MCKTERNLKHISIYTSCVTAKSRFLEFRKRGTPSPTEIRNSSMIGKKHPANRISENKQNNTEKVMKVHTLHENI